MLALKVVKINPKNPLTSLIKIRDTLCSTVFRLIFVIVRTLKFILAGLNDIHDNIFIRLFNIQYAAGLNCQLS